MNFQLLKVSFLDKPNLNLIWWTNICFAIRFKTQGRQGKYKAGRKFCLLSDFVKLPLCQVLRFRTVSPTGSTTSFVVIDPILGFDLSGSHQFDEEAVIFKERKQSLFKFPKGTKYVTFTNLEYGFGLELWVLFVLLFLYFVVVVILAHNKTLQTVYYGSKSAVWFIFKYSVSHMFTRSWSFDLRFFDFKCLRRDWGQFLQAYFPLRSRVR